MTKRLYSRPESVLVVVYTFDLDILLLKRLKPLNFWQSVTGTIRWDENPRQAAIREVREETGIVAKSIVDSEQQRKFRILPEWKERYHPEDKYNLEHLWYLNIPKKKSINLSNKEHSDYKWVNLVEASKIVNSWTNKEAIKGLL